MVEGAPAAAGAPTADAAGRDSVRARGAPVSTAGGGPAPAADSACGAAARAPRASDPAAARAERCTGGAAAEEPTPGGRRPDGAPLRVPGDGAAEGTPPDAAEGLPRAASLPLLAPALRRVAARFEARKAGYLAERGWRADPGSDRLEVLDEPPGPASAPRGAHAALPDPREPCSSSPQAHFALGAGGHSKECGASARGPCGASTAHRCAAEAAQAQACSGGTCGAPASAPAGRAARGAVGAPTASSLASWPAVEEQSCPSPASLPGAAPSSGNRAQQPPPAAQPAPGLPAAADGAALSSEGSSSPARSRTGAAARCAAGAAAPQRRARRRQAAPAAAAPGHQAARRQARSDADAPPAGRAAPAAGGLEATLFHRVPTAPAGLLAPGSPCGAAAAGAAWLSAASPAPDGAAGQRAEWPDPLAWTAEAGVFRYRTLALSFDDAAVPRALRPLVQVRTVRPGMRGAALLPHCSHGRDGPQRAALLSTRVTEPAGIAPAA